MIPLDRTAKLPARIVHVSTPAIKDDGWVGRVWHASQTLLVGGPLNGKRVELTHVGKQRIVCVPNGSSVEWYELGEQPGNDARYYCGTINEEGLSINWSIL